MFDDSLPFWRVLLVRFCLPSTVLCLASVIVSVLAPSCAYHVFSKRLLFLMLCAFLLRHHLFFYLFYTRIGYCCLGRLHRVLTLFFLPNSYFLFQFSSMQPRTFGLPTHSLSYHVCLYFALSSISLCIYCLYTLSI